MSYVTTQNPTITNQNFFNGSNDQYCPAALVARHLGGTHVYETGFVTSWRGKRDTRVSRAFERFQYKISGTEILDFCNKVKKVDGGIRWMPLLDNHPSLSPKLVFSPESFRLSAADRKLQNYVVADVFAKANEAKFNLAVFVAELGETVNYIKNVMQSFVGVTKLYKDAIKRGAKPHSTWLEYRYAIMPLVLTVQDALLALETTRRKEKVQAFKAVPEIDRTKHMFIYPYADLCFISRRTTKLRCGAALEILMQNDVAPWGTSAYDTLMAAWERVPLSFVIDWWLDVGLWLNSFRDTNLIISDKYATLVKEMTLEVWLDERGSAGITRLRAAPTEPSPFVVSAHHIVRSTHDNVLPPNLPCFVPGKLSLLRKLDGLSLIIGALLGLKSKR